MDNGQAQNQGTGGNINPGQEVQFGGAQPTGQQPVTGAGASAQGDDGAVAQGGAAVGGGEDDHSDDVGRPIGTFGRTTVFTSKIKVPAHSLKFDEQYFLRLLAGSISLTIAEKKRIIEAIPKLTQFQIDELIKILEEEKRKFSELDAKHEEQLRALEAKHAQEWDMLELESEQAVKSQEEDAAAEAIRKSLMGNQ